MNARLLVFEFAGSHFKRSDFFSSVNSTILKKYSVFQMRSISLNNMLCSGNVANFSLHSLRFVLRQYGLTTLEIRNWIESKSVLKTKTLPTLVVSNKCSK